MTKFVTFFLLLVFLHPETSYSQETNTSSVPRWGHSEGFIEGLLDPSMKRYKKDPDFQKYAQEIEKKVELELGRFKELTQNDPAFLSRVLPTEPYVQAQSAKEYCSAIQDPHYFQNLLNSDQNRIQTSPNAGWFNAGLCWWRAEFQRNFSYLVYFNPNKPKPTLEEAISLIFKISLGDRVVEIPYYKNAREFSEEYKVQIDERLSDVQAETTIGGGWLYGLRGREKVFSKEIGKEQDRAFAEIRESIDRGQVVYVNLPELGLNAGNHAFLINAYSIYPVVQGGKTIPHYIYQVIDSTLPDLRVLIFGEPEGRITFYPGIQNRFFIIPARQNDFESFADAQKKFCQKH